MERTRGGHPLSHGHSHIIVQKNGGVIVSKKFEEKKKVKKDGHTHSKTVENFALRNRGASFAHSPLGMHRSFYGGTKGKNKKKGKTKRTEKGRMKNITRVPSTARRLRSFKNLGVS